MFSDEFISENVDICRDNYIMGKKVIVLLFVVAVLSALSVADAPPSLENQQLYGTVVWDKSLPTPTQVSVKAGTIVFNSVINVVPCVDAKCSGTYGMEQGNILRVQAAAGEMLAFYVDTVKVLEQVYVPDSATKVDLEWKVVVVEEKKVDEVKKENVTEAAAPSGGGSGSTASKKKSSSGVKNETAALQPCTKSWRCGNGWGECVGGSQTRKCVDEKNCDKLSAEGKVSFVIAGVKPKEVQSCVMPLVIVPVKEDVDVLTVGKEKGIVDEEEEEVTPVVQKPKKASCMDGLKNQNEEDVDCGGVCKACESGLLAGNLIYYILGVVVIIGLSVGVYFFMKSREGGLSGIFGGKGEESSDDVDMQLAQVYNSGEARGLSDSEITSRLVAKGWDEAVLQKFLKGR